MQFDINQTIAAMTANNGLHFGDDLQAAIRAQESLASKGLHTRVQWDRPTDGNGWLYRVVL